MHVRGFTKRSNSGVSTDKRGTLAGVIEKIPYLKDLGITAVELMPVFQYDPDEGNYWGYMPLNFFSPHQGYASSFKRTRAESWTLSRCLRSSARALGPYWIRRRLLVVFGVVMPYRVLRLRLISGRSRSR
jgi:hypothetical protein